MVSKLDSKITLKINTLKEIQQTESLRRETLSQNLHVPLNL